MLRQRGDIGILLCEQYFDFARELADRYMVLSRGEVVASGGRETMDGEDVRRHLSVRQEPRRRMPCAPASGEPSGTDFPVSGIFDHCLKLGLRADLLRYNPRSCAPPPS